MSEPIIGVFGLEVRIDRLVVKTADAVRVRYGAYSRKSHASIEAEAQIRAYGSVACDCLGLCSTETAWRMAVTDALKLHPRPADYTGLAKFEEWSKAITAEAMRILKG